MSDDENLRSYFHNHAPPFPSPPEDEWQRIQARIQGAQRRQPSKVWFYVSAVSLSAAAFVAFVQFQSLAREDENWLDKDDFSYQDPNEEPSAGSYRDWLWLAEHVGEP